MVRIIGGFLLVAIFVLCVLSIIRFPSISPPFMLILSIYVSILWFVKGYYELGLDNVRGQFYAIMSMAFLFQGLAFAFGKINGIITFSIMGTVLMTVGRFFFFAGNLRYLWFFQKSGYFLTFTRFLIVLLAFSVVFTFTFYIPHIPEIFLNMSSYIFFIILDWGMVFIVIYNMLLLWGTDIGRRWAIGSVTIIVHLIGDTTFIAQFSYPIAMFLWGMTYLLMGSVSLMRG